LVYKDLLGSVSYFQASRIEPLEKPLSTKRYFSQRELGCSIETDRLSVRIAAVPGYIPGLLSFEFSAEYCGEEE
jgi:hypothetical protein